MCDVDLTEEWRPVVGWEGLYSVSSLGRVRGQSSGVILSPANSYGYRQVMLWKNNRAHSRMVHVLVAEAFIGPKPPGSDVNHINMCRGDNTPGNLEYLSRSQNALHASSHGALRRPSGRKVPKADIQSIIRRRQDGETYLSIALSYGVRHTSIFQLIKRHKQETEG